MSRIGKKPINIPAGITVSVDEHNTVTVEGAKGKLVQPISKLISVKVEDGVVTLTPVKETTEANSMHGLYRTLVNNMITGLTTGYSKTLVINGVGYKATQKGQDIELNLGLSHPVFVHPMENITLSCPSPLEIKVEGISKDELLKLAKYGEYYSNHPIAHAVLKNDKESLNKDFLKDYQEIDGQGVKVEYENSTLLIGNSKLLSSNNIEFNKVDSPFTILYVAYKGKYLGYIEIKDEIKESSKLAIANYHKNGVKKVIMLTGDNHNIAKVIAQDAGVDEFHANLLPLDKTNKLKEIQQNATTAFIGDGVNDAPSLTTSDIGISMGGIGSDITIDSSDVVIMDDDLNRVNDVIKMSKRNKLVVFENIIFALAVKIGVMILSLIPNLPIASYIMWFAIFADVGVTVICVLNSLRLALHVEKQN